jgi:hypothetical protein
MTEVLRGGRHLRRRAPGGQQYSTGGTRGHHEEMVECWHRGLTAGGVTGYSFEEAWHDYRLSALVAMLNRCVFIPCSKPGARVEWRWVRR